jgi:hypothetical protein
MIADNTAPEGAALAAIKSLFINVEYFGID